MRHTLRDHDYLGHIDNAICKIQRFLKDRCEAEFMEDDLLQDAVIRNLEIIGESVAKLGPELKAQHGDIPFNALSSATMQA